MDVSKDQVLKLWQRGELPTLFNAMDKGERLRFMPEVETILGMASTFYLGKYILGYDKGGRIHREMCDFYDENFNSNMIVLIPRQHYKTTFLNVTGNIRNALNDPNVELCILVHNIEKSEEMFMEIKSHFLYNEKFRDLYPGHATHTNKQEGTKSKFTTPARTKKFLRQPTFSANSIDKGLVSSHFTRFIYDDIVSQKNSRTPELRDSTYQSYSLTLPMIKQMNTQGIPWQHIYGTPWHFDDVYARLQDQNKDTGYFNVFCRPVEWNEEDEVSGNKQHFILFPEEWTQERIDYCRQELGQFEFSCQYMCTPVVKGQEVMDPTKLREFDFDVFNTSPLNKCITVDPASSTDSAKGDPTVISAFAIDYQSNIYTLDVSRKWLEVNEIVDEIVHMHKLHNIRDIGVERVALSKWLIQLLDKKIKDESLNVNIIEMTRDPSIKKKGEGGRQERVAGYLNQGQILIRKNEPEKEMILRELGEWPSGRYDDFMDTLTDAIEILKPPMILKNKGNQYRMPPRQLGGRANHQTGYSYRSGGYEE